jgi:hypothetical protein
MSIGVFITAILGLITSVVVAFFTHKLTTDRERRKYEHEIAKMLAQFPSTNAEHTQSFAVQFAVGVLVVDRPESEDRDRVFLPSGARVTLGRDESNNIVVSNSLISRHHVSFRNADGKTTVEPLGATNPPLVNDEKISKPSIIRDGDIMKLEGLEGFQIQYFEMDSR